MDLKLRGKKVLITGGSAGIGLSIAETFASEGCSLLLVARNEQALRLVADRLARQYQVDVAIEALNIELDATVDYLAAAHADTDILVNNAGAIPGGSLEQLTQQRWREGWELKVFGFLGMTRAFYRVMCAKKHGVIVNVIGASNTGIDARYIAGSTGNAALDALTKGLGSDAPEHGVRVVGVSPGMVLTKRLQSLLEVRAHDKFGDMSRWQELTEHAPFHRVASVEEISAAVVFLASPKSSYTSGAVLVVDGGFSQRCNWWG
jgi:NAD(P)-dependent dehydrogenase (short-subunit alcohol dehydrogenase family)